MALNPGTVVDRYVFEDVLGEGGMAVVYRARHRGLGSLHAIKQLKLQVPAIREVVNATTARIARLIIPLEVIQ